MFIIYLSKEHYTIQKKKTENSTRRTMKPEA